MNKKGHILLLAILILVSLVLSACTIGAAKTVRGSGNVVEETRQVSGITGINLATIGDLTVEVADTESLRIND